MSRVIKNRGRHIFLDIRVNVCVFYFTACKRKEDPQNQPEHTPAPKKPRLVFTDLQRRTLQAIFKVAQSVNMFCFAPVALFSKSVFRVTEQEPRLFVIAASKTSTLIQDLHEICWYSTVNCNAG